MNTFCTQNINYQIEKAQKSDYLFFKNQQEALQFALNCVDLTTLEGNDTEAKVLSLCQKSNHLQPHTAAVCVYPTFVSLARKALANTAIKVACVAGGFPAGQTSLKVKLAEIEYAIEQGAQEIDIVISRGKFLEGKYDEVLNEIQSIKTLCKDIILKVILETGELQNTENIYNASMLAIQGGADFIKTSTGKIAINATPTSFTTMLLAIADYYQRTGIAIGIKPAGGISSISDIELYIKLLEQILGQKWLNNKLFRIGTSRLADKLSQAINQ